VLAKCFENMKCAGSSGMMPVCRLRAKNNDDVRKAPTRIKRTIFGLFLLKKSRLK
jgi:hypothetical protein